MMRCCSKEKIDLKAINKAAKPGRELYHVCPSKLSKRELEDLYFTLLQNNLDLKKTINQQAEKNKFLSTKLQRMTNTQKAYLGKERACCATTKSIVLEQRHVIQDLKRSNEILKEQVKQLNMKLCSTKQFLKRPSKEPVLVQSRASGQLKPVSMDQTSAKNASTSALNTKTKEEILILKKSVSCQCLEKIGLSSSGKPWKSISTATSENNGCCEPVKQCDENKCRTLMEELKLKIVNLQEELTKTHGEYFDRITRLEKEVTDLHSENIRERTVRAIKEEHLLRRETEARAIKQKLTETQCEYEQLVAKLNIEKSKVAELEAHVKAANMTSKAVKSMELRLGADNTEQKPKSSAPESGADTSTPKKLDDSGFTDVNKTATSDEEKEALIKINKELTSKIADLQSELDRTKIFKSLSNENFKFVPVNKTETPNQPQQYVAQPTRLLHSGQTRVPEKKPVVDALKNKRPNSPVKSKNFTSANKDKPLASQKPGDSAKPSYKPGDYAYKPGDYAKTSHKPTYSVKDKTLPGQKGLSGRNMPIIIVPSLKAADSAKNNPKTADKIPISATEALNRSQSSCLCSNSCQCFNASRDSDRIAAVESKGNKGNDGTPLKPKSPEPESGADTSTPKKMDDSGFTDANKSATSDEKKIPTSAAETLPNRSQSSCLCSNSCQCCNASRDSDRTAVESKGNKGNDATPLIPTSAAETLENRSQSSCSCSSSCQCSNASKDSDHTVVESKGTDGTPLKPKSPEPESGADTSTPKKLDDSGFTDANKSATSDEEKGLMKINKELISKIADLQSQLDLLRITMGNQNSKDASPSNVATDASNDIGKRVSLKLQPTQIEPNDIVSARDQDKMYASHLDCASTCRGEGKNCTEECKFKQAKFKEAQKETNSKPNKADNRGIVRDINVPSLQNFRDSISIQKSRLQNVEKTANSLQISQILEEQSRDFYEVSKNIRNQANSHTQKTKDKQPVTTDLTEIVRVRQTIASIDALCVKESPTSSKTGDIKERLATVPAGTIREPRPKFMEAQASTSKAATDLEKSVDGEQSLNYKDTALSLKKAATDLKDQDIENTQRMKSTPKNCSCNIQTTKKSQPKCACFNYWNQIAKSRGSGQKQQSEVQPFSLAPDPNYSRLNQDTSDPPTGPKIKPVNSDPTSDAVSFSAKKKGKTEDKPMELSADKTLPTNNIAAQYGFKPPTFEELMDTTSRNDQKSMGSYKICNGDSFDYDRPMTSSRNKSPSEIKRSLTFLKPHQRGNESTSVPAPITNLDGLPRRYFDRGSQKPMVDIEKPIKEGETPKRTTDNVPPNLNKIETQESRAAKEKPKHMVDKAVENRLGTQAQNDEGVQTQEQLMNKNPDSKTYSVGGLDLSKHSRATSPENTDQEISHLSDLPSEKTTPSSSPRSHKSSSRSPGEDKATTTYTDCGTTPLPSTATHCTTACSLSVGELPQPYQGDYDRRNSCCCIEPRSAEARSNLAEPSSVKVEQALLAITEELARCRWLLQQNKSQEGVQLKKPKSQDAAAMAEAPSTLTSSPHREFSPPNPLRESSDISLRHASARPQLIQSPRVMFTLHIGTVVLSDEAVISSKDLVLVLTWQFYDQNMTMSYMRPGRVVHFDFSTEYDLKLSDQFLEYLKFDELVINVCEANNLDSPLATCSLPLREALLHTNRRADMSLALVAGPRWQRAVSADALDTRDEMGVLDLWCMLRAEPRILPRINKAISKANRPSMAKHPGRPGMSTGYSQSGPIMAQINEDDQDDARLSADLDPMSLERMPTKESKYAFDRGMHSGNQPRTNREHYDHYGYRAYSSGLSPPYSPNSPGPEARRSSGTYLGISQPNPLNTKTNQNSTQDKTQVSFDGPTVEPTSIKSTKEMKEAMQKNYLLYQNRPKERSFVGRRKKQNQDNLDLMSMAMGRSSNSLDDLLNKNDKDTKGTARWPVETPHKMQVSDSESSRTRRTSNATQLSKKYDELPRMLECKKAIEAFKKVKIKHEDSPASTKGVQEYKQPEYLNRCRNQTLDITIQWLALNEECAAMNDPSVQRLYVAYNFLGRGGAELETPMSLPKPKEYQDKCYYNFKKTFQVTDADRPILSRMARCRSMNKGTPNPADVITFVVVSEPVEDPLGLNNCEDIGTAHLYFGDLLAFSAGSDSYTEVVPVRAALHDDSACGVLSIRVDGLDAVRKCQNLSSSMNDDIWQGVPY